MLSAALLWAAATSAAFAAPPAPMPTSAVVSVAYGPPFRLIRGTVVSTASRGVRLSPGDVIEAGPGGLLILEFEFGGPVGAIVAIGPSTRAYWMTRPTGASLVVLAGWVKVDTLSSRQGMEFKTDGLRLGASSGAGTYVLHVGEGIDEVFHESGAMTLWIQNPDGGGAGASSKPNELVTRSTAAAAETGLGPSADFDRRLPLPFFDPLPVGMSAKLHGETRPQVVRDVAYEDVAAWLAAPREWRHGFVERFRPRLKDPSFFHALDSHLSAHPEWRRILHPPPQPPPVALLRAAPPVERGATSLRISEFF